MRNKIIIAVIAIVTALPTQAEDMFTDGETSVDLAGTYTAAQPGGPAEVFDTNARHGDFGVSVGVSHFLTKHIGLSLDATVPAVDDVSGVLVENVSLGVVARLPLGKVAPYVEAGGGRDFETDRWTTHAGTGVEWRFTRNLSSFVGARYTFASSHGEDDLQFRVGIRIIGRKSGT